ncbi:DNA polymerase phi-domain-containing protein [Phakopsora pachyrhizi]|uniref:DNA polymerase phi-domain-containing protein n=1 Tax=Phakopsora pachyrhizi TaxID=170000 RepID=A0AAV0B8P9_PHAPC|nr:DNA polymerase phi-domain-containing protein [Phakopsora pachyrhizi]
MSAQIMSLFPTLSSSNFEERISAATSIVSHLNMTAAESGQTSGDESDKSTSEGGMRSEDLSYTIKRLIRGLASPTARLGFSVALCEIISQFTQLSASTIYDLILSLMPIQGGLKASEERDALFGRLFGFKCILQSGSLFRTNNKAGNQTDSLLVLCKKIADELFTLHRRGEWISQSVGSVLVFDLTSNLLSQPESLYWKAEAIKHIIQKKFIDETSWNLEKLALMIVLQQNSVDFDWKKVTSGIFSCSKILSSSNYDQLYSMLTHDASVKVSADKTSKAVSQPTTGLNTELPPKPHFVHKVIFSSFSLSDKAEFSLLPLYTRLFENYYFTPESSVSLKSHGFLVLIDLLRTDNIPSHQKSEILTQSLVHTMSIQLAVKDRLLHKMAESLVSTLKEEAEKSKARGDDLAKRFATQIRNHKYNFDQQSRTKLLEGLTSHMSTTDLDIWIKELIQAFQNGSPSWETSETVESSDDESKGLIRSERFRGNVLAQLCAILHNRNSPYSKSSAQMIVRSLALSAFFGETAPPVMASKAKKNDSSLASGSAHSDTLLSPGFREVCKARLYTCLLDLMDHNSCRYDPKRSFKAGNGQDDSQGFRGIGTAIDAITLYFKSYSKEAKTSAQAKKGESASTLSSFRETLMRVRDHASMVKTCEISRSRQESIVILCEAVFLMSYDHEEELLETLPQFEQLEKVVEIIIFKGDEPNTSTFAEKIELSMKTLNEILVHLISWPIAFLRAVAGRVFDSFLEYMSPESLKIWTQQLNPPDFMAECDSKSNKSSNSAAEDSSCECSEDDSSTIASSAEDADDDEADNSADEAFRKEVAMALGHALAQDEADERSSGESELMDDDEMLALDTNLAAIFRKRTGKKFEKAQQTQDLHLRMKILELMARLTKRRKNTLIFARLFEPLLELIRKTNDNEVEMKKKILRILHDATRQHKQIPVEPSFLIKPFSHGEWSKIFIAVHQIARTSPEADLVDICAQCNVWLIDVLVNDKSELVADNKRALAIEELEKINLDSLTNFCTKKASRLRPNFFLQISKRFPMFLWKFRNEMLALATGSQTVNSYRREQMFLVISSLMSSCATKLFSRHPTDTSLEDMTSFAHSVHTSALGAGSSSIVENQISKSLSKKQQTDLLVTKELLKISLNFLQRSTKIDMKENIIQEWPVLTTRKLLELTKKIVRSPSRDMIERLIQQHLKLLKIDTNEESTNQHVENKKRKKSLAKKQQFQSKDEDLGDSTSGSSEKEVIVQKKKKKSKNGKKKLNKNERG